MHETPLIRPLHLSDNLVRLTELIHAAYALHAARGLLYWGTHQSVEDTAKRFASGHGLVAELRGEYVGTITVCPPQPKSPIALYCDPYTWSIAQFAVAPSFKGRGLGKALHEAAATHAHRAGGRTMALDTAAAAEGLIAMYRAWGYELVEEHDWRPHTNYLSVVMRRPLDSSDP
jgi:GNAT superfamily N-acetyltransferase